MFFSDLHVQILARGLLQPGEQLVGQAVTDYMPWWAFGLVRRQHLVLATDQRIVILDHRYDLWKVNQVLHAVESLPWSGVVHAKVTGLFKKKLKIRGTNEQGRQVDISAKLPKSFLPAGNTMKNNMQGARNVVTAFQSRGQALALGGAPVAQLSGGHGQPIPMVNAPGYNSAPPPAPGPYGAAPPTSVHSPFVPPRA